MGCAFLTHSNLAGSRRWPTTHLEIYPKRNVGGGGRRGLLAVNARLRAGVEVELQQAVLCAGQLCIVKIEAAPGYLDRVPIVLRESAFLKMIVFDISKDAGSNLEPCA